MDTILKSLSFDTAFGGILPIVVVAVLFSFVRWLIALFRLPSDFSGHHPDVIEDSDYDFEKCEYCRKPIDYCGCGYYE